MIYYVLKNALVLNNEELWYAGSHWSSNILDASKFQSSKEAYDMLDMLAKELGELTKVCSVEIDITEGVN